MEQRFQKFHLLRTVVEQPDLTLCQGAEFEEMRMYWDGNAWVMEFSATVNDKG
jgi:hypothetical protein